MKIQRFKSNSCYSAAYML